MGSPKPNKNQNETTQDLGNNVGAEVEGANDPSISSRAKDDLFADAPRSETMPQFQAPNTEAAPDESLAAAPVDNVPAEHDHGDYSDTEDYDTNKTADDADFEAPEVNRKGSEENNSE